MEKDLAAAASAQAAGKAPAPLVKAPTPAIAAGESARINLTGMRKVIAERLSSSLGPIPHFYLNIEINADSLMRLRAELKSADENDDAGKITVNDFILESRGCGRAARAQGQRFLRRRCDRSVRRYQSRGRGRDRRRPGHTRDSVGAEQVAPGNQCGGERPGSAGAEQAHETGGIPGGTLTVSNLGSYGIDYFSAVINPPQAIILSVGAIVRQAVVNEAGEIVPGYRMKVGMSCDHRVVDGAIGAEYLKALRQLLENPSRLLL